MGIPILKVYDADGNQIPIPAIKGETGAQGIPGSPGSTGPQGEKGDPFRYSDFTPEQLAALKGPKGDPGDTGATGPQGPQGIPGTPGSPGADGDDGVGIASITFKQATAAGNVYTVTLTNGTTYEITAPKGAQGETGATGPAGADGQDGSDGAPGQDGITPTIGENGNWFLGSTDTGKPSRGEQGIQGIQGVPGQNGSDGSDGEDGYSPSVAISTITGGHSVTITDKTHQSGQTFNVMDGENGQDGAPGSDGADGVTFTPSVDESGVISWTNNGGLPNPESRSIKGPAGSDASVTAANIQAALGFAPVSPTQLSAKLNIAQGVSHAGEFFVVGSDGNATTQAFSVLGGGSY